MVRKSHAIAFVWLLMALATPYISRYIGTSTRGWSWFTSYSPSIGAVFFLTFVNLLHGATLYGLALTKEGASLRYCVAAITSLLVAGYMHFGVDLASSSTAAITLLWIPLYGTIVALLVWWITGPWLGKPNAS